MITAALLLFLLRKLPFSRFSFPRWQSVLAMTLVGLVFAAVPSGPADEGDNSDLPFWISATLAVVAQWTAFFSVYLVLYWWLRRRGHWDGRGDCFNLLAASWLVADLLAVYLPVLGVHSALITVLLAVYSFVITLRAMRGAVPGLSLGYASAGVLLGALVMLLAASSIHEQLAAVLMPAEALSADAVPPDEGDGWCCPCDNGEPAPGPQRQPVPI